LHESSVVFDFFYEQVWQILNKWGNNWESETDRQFEDLNVGIDTENSFRNLIKSSRIQIVFTIFQLIWNQTDVRLVPNRSANGKYNRISVWFNTCFETLYLAHCPHWELNWIHTNTRNMIYQCARYSVQIIYAWSNAHPPYLNKYINKHIKSLNNHIH